MKKKLLLAENANLFAEIERKQIETQTLKFKLEENTRELEALKIENERAKEKILLLENELGIKNDEIEALKSLLAEEKEKTPAKEEPAAEVKEENKEKKEELCLEKTHPLTVSQKEELSIRCARAIAKITKITAYIAGEAENSSAEGAEQIYSMALGKNEAFKIKAAKLLEENGSYDQLCSKLSEITETAEKEIKELI